MVPLFFVAGYMTQRLTTDLRESLSRVDSRLTIFHSETLKGMNSQRGFPSIFQYRSVEVKEFPH